MGIVLKSYTEIIEGG